MMKKLFWLGLLSVVFHMNAQDRYGGLALYTVREDMGKNPIETLKKIADIGYVNLEAAGYDQGKYYGMSPKAFQKELQKLGLSPLSTHQSSITPENADEQFAAAKAAGFTYFVVPIPPMGMFTINRETMVMGMDGSVEDLANILNDLGKKASTYNLQLLYHNHDFEFRPNEEGVIPIEYLLKNVNPAYVNFEMDLFWVVKAGANPLDYFERYPGRFKLWHVKDMGDEDLFAPVGEGSIDFKSILVGKDRAGMKAYFVEQDMTFDLTPIEAISISHKALKEIGFD